MSFAAERSSTVFSHCGRQAARSTNDNAVVRVELACPEFGVGVHVLDRFSCVVNALIVFVNQHLLFAFGGHHPFGWRAAKTTGQCPAPKAERRLVDQGRSHAD